MIDFIALILEKKADLTLSQADNQLIIFFKDFFKVVIGVIGLLLILKALGYNIRYNLDSFVHTYSTKVTVYTGSPFFEEMTSSDPRDECESILDTLEPERSF